jgi:hypothetical protein
MLRYINRSWLILTLIIICSAGTLFCVRYLLKSGITEEVREQKEEKEEEGFDNPQGYAEFYKLITSSIRTKKNGYKINYRYKELTRAIKNLPPDKSALSYDWEQRGPGNVGGRTREVIIDPDDPTHNTWYAAAASGGIWKTTDGGNSWTNLTDQLSNLATNSIAMAPSDRDIIYIGTGEGYGGFGMVSGSGLFRSDDRGLSWDLLESTLIGDAFRWVNKIVVDSYDANIILVATNEGIFKTYDGGMEWDTVYYTGYTVQDIVVNPLDPYTIYAGVNSLGIIKSYNNGNTWVDANTGIGTGYRFSVAVSPADTSYVYTSVEAPGTETELYISSNGGASWNKLNDYDNTFINFHGEQGWFNNVIEADPFNKLKVFIGGVYLGSVSFKSAISISDPQLLRVDTIGTGSFLTFVNFGGSFLRGSLSTGLEEDADVEEEDYTSVEIRFGPGISQKAHRFTVPEGEGSGVPPADFQYRDYVEVPFQAWDTDHNIQLMVSFRDQENDGEFNLIERVFDDDISGREYIYVHAKEYSAIADPDIAVNGGHLSKMLYFLWPSLTEDKTWQPDQLPDSKIRMQYGTFTLQNASTTVLADEDRNSDLHVDHHDMKIIVTDEAEQEYIIIETNDGGLGRSDDKGLTWRQIRNGYNTTQFYGIAKKPGANEFIGGMQDNGTWQSPAGENAGSSSAYNDRIKGDGFEALWHPLYPHRILASSYYNSIHLSADGGESWSLVTDGISGSGPFITRLSNSPANPNLVFAVGDKGIFRNTNFCVGRYPWRLIEIDSSWSISGTVTSAHNVKVSLADPSVVWAGAGMFRDPDLDIFLSNDYGLTFEKVNIYPDVELGYLTSIATHPTDTGTAYLLFSIDHKPKILRTIDFGESWEDISGFGTGDSSQNGFPDVLVYSLLVFPGNTDIIWAGTEIGIFESIDNGQTWHYANNGFPAVSVWQMFIQDNILVVATHGRGIWTSIQRPDAIPENEFPVSTFNVYPNPGNGIINIEIKSSELLPGEISVFSLSGKTVYSKRMLNSNEQINLSSLNKGIYIISIETGNKRYSQRYIKY